MVYDIDGLKYALSTLESVDNYPLQITVKIASVDAKMVVVFKRRLIYKIIHDCLVEYRNKLVDFLF